MQNLTNRSKIVSNKNMSFKERIYLPAIVGGMAITMKHFFKKDNTVLSSYSMSFSTLDRRYTSSLSPPKPWATSAMRRKPFSVSIVLGSASSDE